MAGQVEESSVGEAGVNSGGLMLCPLPPRGWEALGDDLAEHPQDFLTSGSGQVRPHLGQRPGTPRGLSARGGTAQRWEWDMVALRAIGRVNDRDVNDTTAPASAAQPY